MRDRIRSAVLAGPAVAVIGVLILAPVSAPAPPDPPRTVTGDVRLTSAVPLGAIPLAFLRNQGQYCSVICPLVVQGAVTVPIAAALTPVTFAAALGETQSLPRAIGATAASVTGPLNDAAEPILRNDLNLVLPKAQHALQVAVVEASNIAGSAGSPGDFVAAVDTGRSRVLDALNQPMGPPTTSTGAQGIAQVSGVEAINVASAVTFQAGELALLGVVQTADATAQNLARTGDARTAVAAGAAQARATAREAGGVVTNSVRTAASNIRASAGAKAEPQRTAHADHSTQTSRKSLQDRVATPHSTKKRHASSTDGGSSTR